MTDLRKLLDDCRLEMGGDVFSRFKADMAGSKPTYVPRNICGVCQGVGIHPFKTNEPCTACNGTGKF